MILAAAAFGEGKTKIPPRELSLLQDCDRFHQLPRGGGLLDQPASLVRRMRVCENVVSAMRLWRDSDWTTFAQKHPTEWDVVQHVMTLREAQKPG